MSIRGLSCSEWQAILENGKKPLVFAAHPLITQFRPSAFRKKFKNQTFLTVDPWTELLIMASHPGKWQKTTGFCRPPVDHTI